MPPREPIDLPDDFGLDDDRRGARVVMWAAAALFLTLAIAVLAILGAFA